MAVVPVPNASALNRVTDFNPPPDVASAAPPGPAARPAGTVELPAPEVAPAPAVATGVAPLVDPAVSRAQYVPSAATGSQARPAGDNVELPEAIGAPVVGGPEGELPPVVETQAGGEVSGSGGDLPPVAEPVPPSPGDGELPAPSEAPALESAPEVPSLMGEEEGDRPSTEVSPLPEPLEGMPPPDPSNPQPKRPKTGGGEAWLEEKTPSRRSLRGASGSRKIFLHLPAPRRSRGSKTPNGLQTLIIRGGVNITMRVDGMGDVDISADNAIIWRRIDGKGGGLVSTPDGGDSQNANQPMEVYLEGNVIFLQDERKVAGNGDQKTYRAKQAYYDAVSDRFVALEAELDMFAPGLIAPAKMKSPRIDQFRALEQAADGSWVFGLQQIRADKTVTTGSRFPKPGYRFNSQSIDVNRVKTDLTDPNSGKTVGDEEDPDPPDDLTWRIDARQNIFWMGRVPVFYWPRFVADAEDLEPPLRMLSFRTNNYFGQQLLLDFNGFRLIGVKRPKYVDLWNVDLDYLSARSKRFPALGTEIGWFGNDLINDLSDPYDKVKEKTPTFTKNYFGYFDIWGLYDSGRDTLGSGPAIITNNVAAGKAGYQRGGGGPLGSVPSFTDPRGRLSFRHMQRVLPDDDEHLYEDLRLQLEVGTYSDRYFLEEYYKRLFDTGMDQETLAYLIRQKENWAYTLWTEGNLQNWYTDTQWLPRADYYRFGDSLLNDRLTYFQHSGVDNANVHTASEVNNPNIFAYMPYDPISNTSGVWQSGRAYTTHEVDMKLNMGNILRLVPYVQGQAVGWTNQINGESVGRYWGAAGLRAEIMAWKAYPWVESDLLNVDGLSHKVSFDANFRDAFSNVNLNTLGVQDQLDDNTYEWARRYFALTNYFGGILPPQYDPRHLILRRTISPITGTTDVQASMNTLQMNIHQRLQTKRGPEGRRRVIDYMTLDLDTTYFPYASRDNFGKPFGQNTYNWQWFIGDRTSITSYGWFEFWKLTGNPIYATNTGRHNDPFGLNMVTTGVNISRPPRGTVFVGYSVVNTGPINTSAVTTSISYWLSPKWYGTYSTMYDFGNGILLSASFSVTRIGADYLTSIGLTVDPQRQSYMFAFQISPRLSPNMKVGSGVMAGFDARYAPTQ